jgi:hypothetical protein
VPFNHTPPSSTNSLTPALNTALEDLSPVASSTDALDQFRPIADEVDARLKELARRSDCVKRLGELHQRCLGDTDMLRGCHSADQCMAISDMSLSNPDFFIGRILNASKELLEIMDHFDLQQNGGSQATTPEGRLYCDVPTLFSLMSCYVSVVRLYRYILSVLLDSLPDLRQGVQPHKLPNLPQLLPGLDLGGYKLDGQFHIQVGILVQVAEDLLYQMESKVGIRGGMNLPSWKPDVGPTRMTGMLWMMLEQESAEQPPLDEQRGKCGTLKEVLAELKKELTPDKR